LTAIVTATLCVVVMVAGDGVTVTAGVSSAGPVTVTVADPVAPLYVAALAESGV
jgi:hypothetical protein